MPETIIFVGSSSSARSQAKAVIKAFTGPTLRFLPWWEAFTAGRTLLEELDAVRARVNGALLVFSPESTTWVRGHKQEIPNLNVLFELGYFYGHFGKQRVAMLKYGDFYLPSDLGGYVHIFGSSTFKRGSSIKGSRIPRLAFMGWNVRPSACVTYRHKAPIIDVRGQFEQCPAIHLFQCWRPD